MSAPLKILVLAAVTLTLNACARNEAAPASTIRLPEVSVAPVLAQATTDFDQFTGRIEPVERVQVRPRVSGYVASTNFAEGGEVRKGDVLFVIDPRPYEAELKNAQAQLASARAALVLAHSEHERAGKLLAAHALSQQEYDSRIAGQDQAQAAVQSGEAAVEAAALNLSFTRVQAPISGRVGRAEVTTGNSVSAGQTLLTTLVSVDPVYVEFESDEQAYLKHVALRGKTRASDRPLWVGLANEEGYPHTGQLVFLDNELDAATGTIRVRGRLDNHDRVLTPGMFARVKLAASDEYRALLVRDSAIGTDQGVKFVYVVDGQGKVEYRPVKVGPLADGLRVVREGLVADESVIVSGLQRVRPGDAVKPQQVAMVPTASAAALLARNARK